MFSDYDNYYYNNAYLLFGFRHFTSYAYNMRTVIIEIIIFIRTMKIEFFGIISPVKRTHDKV